MTVKQLQTAVSVVAREHDRLFEDIMYSMNRAIYRITIHTNK